MKKTLIPLYIIASVVTFGHAWNRDYSKTNDPQGAALIAAYGAAIFWPLYWSTVAWEHESQNPEKPSK